jgi:hypothetical protein
MKYKIPKGDDSVWLQLNRIDASFRKESQEYNGFSDFVRGLLPIMGIG